MGRRKDEHGGSLLMKALRLANTAIQQPQLLFRIAPILLGASLFATFTIGGLFIVADLGVIGIFAMMIVGPLLVGGAYLLTKSNPHIEQTIYAAFAFWGSGEAFRVLRAGHKTGENVQC